MDAFDRLAIGFCVMGMFGRVPYVTRPGAPIETKASFVVESGRAGTSPAYSTHIKSTLLIPTGRIRNNSHRSPPDSLLAWLGYPTAITSSLLITPRPLRTSVTCFPFLRKGVRFAG